MRAALAHRGGLTPNLRPDPTLFARIGGRSVTGRIIDGLYDRIENDAELRPMFTRTLASERMKQKAFMEEWMGGEPDYTRHHAYGGITRKHGHIHITRESAERWLMHMAASLRDNVGEVRLVDEVLATLGPLAHGLVNEDNPPKNRRQLRCHREKRYRHPARLAARGQLDELKRCLDEDPAVLSDPRHGAILLVEAALRGRTAVAAMLLDRGVDVNLPAAHTSDLMLTPYCAARCRKKLETARFLLDRGAVYDIFSACFLGDPDRISSLLEVLLRNHAPVDARSDRGETPLFYALKAGPRADMVKTVELLLSHGADPHREDDSGKSPWSIARRMRHPDASKIIELFEAARSGMTA